MEQTKQSTFHEFGLTFDRHLAIQFRLTKFCREFFLPLLAVTRTYNQLIVQLPLLHGFSTTHCTCLWTNAIDSCYPSCHSASGRKLFSKIKKVNCIRISLHLNVA